jgi:U5 small nuclear ribonucleoprotein component
MVCTSLALVPLLLQARYRVPITRAVAGNLVLVEGIDATITKTATVVPEDLEQEMHIFRWAGAGC